MHYQELAPHPRLAPFVRTCWTLTGTAAEMGPQPVVPDGCTELIVHRARPFLRYTVDGAAGITTRQATQLFVAQMRAPVVLSPDGNTDIVAIRFEPFGAAALIGGSQSAVVDDVIDAAALGERWLTRALNNAESANSAEESLQILERALLARLDERRLSVDARVIEAVRCLSITNGAMSIDDAAMRVGTSARHLERLFLKHVGVPPKSLARVLRFQAAATNIATESARSFSDISSETGYADQSHMIRDFVTLAGTTPQQFQKSLGALTKMMLS